MCHSLQCELQPIFPLKTNGTCNPCSFLAYYDTIHIGIRIKMILWERKNGGVPIRYAHGAAPA